MTWEFPRITKNSDFLFSNPEDAYPLGIGKHYPMRTGTRVGAPAPMCPHLCAPALCCSPRWVTPAFTGTAIGQQTREGRAQARPAAGAARGTSFSGKRSALRGQLGLAAPLGSDFMWCVGVAHFLELSCAHFTSSLTFTSSLGASEIDAGWPMKGLCLHRPAPRVPAPPPLPCTLRLWPLGPLLVLKRPK